MISRPSIRARRAGIALIIVMLAVTVLSILAAAFAFSMKVEMRLAQNSNAGTDLLWLGRSGVEYARYILAQSCEPYDGLNQKWAGGEGSNCETNGFISQVNLREWYNLGDGKFKITITDAERKFNVNVADQPTLEQALRVVGVDAGDAAPIAASILDWIDPDDTTHVGGTESPYYQSQDPPYFAKNQYIDDISELLLVKGVTPEIYRGGVATNAMRSPFQNRLNRPGSNPQQVEYPVGLRDLLTPLSNGKININTANAHQLQMIPYVNDAVAEQLIKFRSGPDAVEGTADDTPAGMAGISLQTALLSAGLDNQRIGIAQALCTVRSAVFYVRVHAEIGGAAGDFIGVIARNNPRDIQVLSFRRADEKAEDVK